MSSNKQSKFNKYNTEEDRHKAILEAKRNYYHRNSLIYKLKSSKNYYKKRLNIPELTEDKKNLYLLKINELDNQISSLNSKKDISENISDVKNTSETISEDQNNTSEITSEIPDFKPNEPIENTE